MRKKLPIDRFHPILILTTLIILRIILDQFDNITIKIFTIIINFGIVILIPIILIYELKRNLKRLLTAQNIITLTIGYTLFVFGLIALFAMLYSMAFISDTGYLTYGGCSNNFNNDDPDMTHNYFYFSTMTFFTVGYGDICPMGMSKNISIFNAFFGNFFTVIIMVLVLTNYTNKKK